MKINYLVVHCTDSPNDRDNVDAAEIHKWHLQNGWSGIGYHYVIKRDGTVENGRPEYWQGAHARRVNSESLGICLVGRDKFTDEQIKTLETLLKKLKGKYENAKIIGHHEVDPKRNCPNFDVQNWWSKELA